jgi:hypothetical protein
MLNSHWASSTASCALPACLPCPIKPTLAIPGAKPLGIWRMSVKGRGLATAERREQTSMLITLCHYARGVVASLLLLVGYAGANAQQTTQSPTVSGGVH